MTDISDVENAFVSIIGNALCAPGWQPNVLAASILPNLSVKVFRGWPAPNEMNKDLAQSQPIGAAKIAYISVFPMQNGIRNVARYPIVTKITSTPVPTLTGALAGLVVTFGGTAGVNQVVGILCNNVGYAYRMTANDTPTTIAAWFAAAIPGASATGAAVTLPPCPDAAVRIMADAAGGEEVSRSIAQFFITLFCPTPYVRDTLASYLDPIIQAAGRLTLADGSQTDIIRYVGSFTNDATQKASLWERRLTYSVEFATTLSQTYPRVMFPFITALVNNSVLKVIGPEPPLTQVMLDLSGNVAGDGGGSLIASP